jgi:hypothetical protein
MSRPILLAGAALFVMAAAAPAQAQDTLSVTEMQAVRARYPHVDQWDRAIRIRSGTRLDSLQRRYHNRLRRLMAGDVEDRSPYPLWYRGWLRDRFPDLPTSGPYQYPRVAAQILEWMQAHPDFAVPPRTPPGASAHGPARMAVVGTNVNVSNVNEIHSESNIAVNYADPNRIVAASNNITGSGRQKIFFSGDGGASWNSTELPLADGARFDSDPSVAWAPDGAAWSATLGIDLSGGVKVQVFKSTTQGATWTFVKTVSTGTNNDKELMWIDTDPSSPFKGNIYVAWDEVGNGMRFARSTDNGATWSAVTNLSSDVAVGADLTTGPAGELYVAWPDVNSRTLKVRKSTDGGATFAAVRTIASTNGQFDVSIPAMCSRNVLIYVIVGVDRSSGPRRGNVYAEWDDRNGSAADPGCTGLTNASNTSVYFSRSTNGGSSWSTPAIVGSNPALTDQFNPWMDVDPTNGQIHTAYYDTRDDTGRKDASLWFVWSDDGGLTFKDETKVASAPTDESDGGADLGNQYGDYNGLAVYNAVSHPTWTDRRAGNPGGREQIYTARITVSGDTTTPPPAPIADGLTLTVSPSGALSVGGTATATATLTLAGAPVAGQQILFSTLDPSIATVSPSAGVTNASGTATATVTAVAKGSTMLTAAGAGLTASVSVKVPTLSLIGALVLALAMIGIVAYRRIPRARRT